MTHWPQSLRLLTWSCHKLGFCLSVGLFADSDHTLPHCKPACLTSRPEGQLRCSTMDSGRGPAFLLRGLQVPVAARPLMWDKLCSGRCCLGASLRDGEFSVAWKELNYNQGEHRSSPACHGLAGPIRLCFSPITTV